MRGLKNGSTRVSKCRGTTSIGQTPLEFPEIKLKVLQDIQKLVSKCNVPPKLLVIWDQTACKYVQCGEWTIYGTICSYYWT